MSAIESARLQSDQTVEIRLFALAAQMAGSSRVHVSVPQYSSRGRTISIQDIAGELIDQYPQLAGLIGQSRWANGDDFVQPDQTIDLLKPLALIPPVSGG